MIQFSQCGIYETRGVGFFFFVFFKLTTSQQSINDLHKLLLQPLRDDEQSVKQTVKQY